MIKTKLEKVSETIISTYTRIDNHPLRYKAIALILVIIPFLIFGPKKVAIASLISVIWFFWIFICVILGLTDEIKVNKK